MDDLSHYLCCECFWTIIVNCANAGVRHLGVMDPCVRLGLHDPTSSGCYLICLAFLVYHAIKSQHLEVVLQAHTKGDLSEVHDLTREFARYHNEKLLLQQRGLQ